MKKHAVLAFVAAALASGMVVAQTVENVVTYNIGATSDNRFRGISHSSLLPSLHAGVNFRNDPTGLFAGGTVSTIQIIKDTPGAGTTPVRFDLYVGKGGRFTETANYDFGVQAAIFPGNKMPTNMNTYEAF